MLNNIEAQAFIDLSVTTLENSCDSVIDNSILDTYLNELNIHDYTPSKRSLSSIFAVLLKSTKQVQRCVIIELCGLLHSVKGYGPKTEDWVYSIAEKLKIDRAEASRLIRWSNDFSEFLGIGLMYINAK